MRWALVPATSSPSCRRSRRPARCRPTLRSSGKTMDAGIQSMMSLAQQQPLAKAPGRVGASQSGNQMNSTGSIAAADKSSKEYEQVFISQFLGSMFSGISADGVTGGGEGEEMFRSMMIDQYGKSMEQRGGFGLADAVQRQLLKHQEVPVTPDAAAN